MKKYMGVIRVYRKEVYVDVDGKQELLSKRLDLADHSFDFSWGYGGSGPTQLALALLADATQDDELAMSLASRFARDVISRKAGTANWELTEGVVLVWVELAKEKDELLNRVLARGRLLIPQDIVLFQVTPIVIAQALEDAFNNGFKDGEERAKTELSEHPRRPRGK